MLEIKRLKMFQCSSDPFTNVNKCVSLLPPATKLGQGNIFTGICDSVKGGASLPGGCLLPGGVSGPGRGGCLVPGGCLFWGVSGPRGVSAPDRARWRPPGTATAAGGTHPTGMHSCFAYKFISFSWTIKKSRTCLLKSATHNLLTSSQKS